MMDQHKKISVIIPCYNYGHYLRECILSVLNQSYQNLEVIVVDDGSTDESFSIAKQLESEDSRVRVITQNNGGVASARNRGLEEATGDEVFFLDADDSLLPDCLNRLSSHLCASECDFVYCAYILKHDKTRIVQPMEFEVGKLKIRNFISVSSLYRIEAIGNHRFDEVLEMDEDYEFVLGLVEAGAVGSCLKDPLFVYNKHADSRSSEGFLTLKGYRNRKKILRKHQGFYSKKEKAEALKYSEYSLLRSIRYQREHPHSLKTRVYHLFLVVRFSKSPKEWLLSLRYVLIGSKSPK